VATFESRRGAAHAAGFFHRTGASLTTGFVIVDAYAMCDGTGPRSMKDVIVRRVIGSHRGGHRR
jgi:hypothetical protein